MRIDTNCNNIFLFIFPPYFIVYLVDVRQSLLYFLYIKRNKPSQVINSATLPSSTHLGAFSILAVGFHLPLFVYYTYYTTFKEISLLSTSERKAIQLSYFL